MEPNQVALLIGIAVAVITILCAVIALFVRRSGKTFLTYILFVIVHNKPRKEFQKTLEDNGDEFLSCFHDGVE